MTTEMRRPGVYGVNPKTEPEMLPLPTEPPATDVAPAPPLPPAAPTAPMLDPRNPVDQLAQQILNEEVLAGTIEERAEQIEAARAKARDYLNLTPAERWKRNIENAKLTEDEAFAILDQVLENGYWEKTYALYNGRLKVTLRTRDAASHSRVVRALDDIKTYDMNILRQTERRILLACSLVRYRDKALPTASPDQPAADHERAFEARLTFCDRFIAGPAIEAVYAVLLDFDKKTYAALSEGAPAGF